MKVRTRDGTATWSGWTPLDYHDDHGPDPDSEEAAKARPGTDEMLVGDVDQVQVRIDTRRRRAGRPQARRHRPGRRVDDEARAAPRSTPAPCERQRRARPRHDRPTAAGRAATGGRVAGRRGVHAQAGDLLAGPSGAPTSRCATRARCTTTRCTRASCTTRSTPTTTRPSDVPGDPARHLRLPHASPAAGATSATTTSSTASAGSGRAATAASTAPSSVPTRSATTTTRSRCRRSATSRRPSPPTAMVEAYGALFAWKLSLHGVDASSTKQYVTERYFQAINGHRDAASTACPGKYLYAQHPRHPHARRAGPGRLRRPPARVRPGRARPSPTSSCAASPTARASSCRSSRQAAARLDRRGSARSPPASTCRPQNRILNAGDWDRDGTPTWSPGTQVRRHPLPPPRPRQRQFGKVQPAGHRLQGRRPARRRRRHDRRRLARPDGPARRRRRCGSTPAGAGRARHAATSPTAGSRPAADRHRAAGTATARRTAWSATAASSTSTRATDRAA